MFLQALCCNAQVTYTANDNAGPPGSYLGWDWANNLDFRTNDITRMRMMQTGTNTIDGYTINNSGFVGLTIDPTFHGTTGAGAKPYSLLHLNGQWNAPWGPQEGGYRPWMVPGIVFTHNQDIMYVGPKRNGTDMTDAVVAWGDNSQPGGNGPDVLRFLFLFEGNGTANSSNPMLSTDGDGVECARFSGDSRMGVGPMWTNSMMPKRALDVVRRYDAKPQFRLTYTASTTSYDLGIHTDFQTSEDGIMYIYPRDNNVRKAVAIGSLDGDLSVPIDDTWLDVGGQTRIRDLQEETPRTLIIGFQDDDANQGVNDHMLGRLDFIGDPCMVLSSNGTWTDICDLDGNDCRWSDNGSGTVFGETDMYTAYDPVNEECYRGKVGVGVRDVLNGKLEVWMINNSGDIRNDEILTGTYSRATAMVPGIQNEVLGISGIADCNGQIGTSQSNIGVNGMGTDSRYVCGVRGQGKGIYAANGYAYGVWGEADGAQNYNVGVYGRQGTGAAVNLAGYFNGTVVMNQPPLYLSDQSLKTDITDFENATELLNQLAPKTYFLQAPSNNPISFSEDMQYGLIAQEVQSVIPDIVHETLIPPAHDSTGFIENTEVQVLGVEYDQLIPILIKGFNEQSGIVSEQQGLIEEQSDLIETMEETIAAQASQMEALQAQMQDVLTQVQNMEIATSNCCTQKSGTSTQSPRGDENSQEMKLGQNVPNPFTNLTRIDFELLFEAQVILEITDGTGRPIQTLIDGQMSSGMHSTIWDGSGVAPGMYYYTLYANGELLSKKMIKR